MRQMKISWMTSRRATLLAREMIREGYLSGNDYRQRKVMKLTETGRKYWAGIAPAFRRGELKGEIYEKAFLLSIATHPEYRRLVREYEKSISGATP